MTMSAWSYPQSWVLRSLQLAFVGELITKDSRGVVVGNGKQIVDHVVVSVLGQLLRDLPAN